ncbi:MAG: tRNA lysidine(34) synthetase TilS, partial [Flavobacteriaceae bacterium]|nr:tRNA lysidine(34) synthetase TilS [Flavobacteriaceae bacterium]
SRGSGLSGLAGIPVKNQKIVRPLLPFMRNEIETYARTNQIEWREDSSNVSQKYLRNRIRQEVIPVLKAVFPEFLDGLEKSQNHISEANDVLDLRIRELEEEMVTFNADEIVIDLKKLGRYKSVKPFLYLLLKDYGFTQWTDIENLTNAQPGKQVFSNSWRLLKDRDKLILSPLSDGDQAAQLIPEGTSQVSTVLGVLDFEVAEDYETASEDTIYVDRDKLDFPLECRPWEKGDYFYPLGMKGRKKVSKYFKDEKLSLIEKEKSRLLCSGNNIVWIVGRRADDRFKVTKGTKHILKIALN